MKKNISVIVVLVAIFTSIFTAGAATVTETVFAYANAGVKEYRLYAGFTGVANGATNWHNQNLVLVPAKSGTWVIVDAVLDDVRIPIDPEHPLYTLPSFGGKVYDYNLNVQGVNESGDVVRYGYAYKPELKPGDDLTIFINLSNVRATVPRKLTDGHNASNTKVTTEDGQSVGWYDQDAKAVIAYYNPLNPPKRLLLVDTRTNSVFDTIDFEAVRENGGNSQSDQSNGVAFSLPYGAWEANMTTETSYLSFVQRMNENLVGTNYNAYGIIQAVSSDDRFDAWLGGLDQKSEVTLFGIDQDGNATMIQTAVPNVNGYVQLQTFTGFKAYAVQIKGRSAYSDNVVNVQINRYGSGGVIVYGGGGGKG